MKAAALNAALGFLIYLNSCLHMGKAESILGPGWDVSHEPRPFGGPVSGRRSRDRKMVGMLATILLSGKISGNFDR